MALTRRDFLKVIGVGGVSTAAAIALASCGQKESDTETTPDSNVSGNETSNTVVEGSTGGANEALNNASNEAVDSIATDVHDEKHMYTSLTARINGDPGTLYPHGTSANGRNNIRQMQYESLFVTADQDSTDKSIVPLMAKGYERVSDGVYDIEIYDYITDWNGNSVTADDVVFSFNGCIEDGNSASAFATFDRIEATDATHIRLYFKEGGERSADFETVVTTARVVSQKSFEESADGMVTDPIGTNAYKLESYEPASSYVYVVNENYWQPVEKRTAPMQLTMVDKVDLRVIKDTTTAALALENREIDCGSINDDDLSLFLNDDLSAKVGYYCEMHAGNSLMEICFNCSEKSPCSDINLRKAINYAVDMDAIAYSIFGNRGHAAKGIAVPYWIDNICDEVADHEYFKYDIQLAEEYLKKSNYKGETLRMLVNPTAPLKTTATMMQAYLDAVGISLELLIYESALYEEYHKENDGERYDMDLQFVAANFYSWQACQTISTENYTNGLNHNIIYDETLQNLYDAASAVVHTKEDVIALNDYLEEMAYLRGVWYNDRLQIGLDRFTDLIYNNTDPIYGACYVLPDEA